MKIPVPEVEERFDSTEDALEYILRLCNVIVEKAKCICPEPSVNDIPAYALEFCRKVLLQAMTLVKVAREREDYNTLCALVRILADNVATLNLVYNCEDNEEKALRHLLYVMDGVSLRHKTLIGHPMKYDGKIPREVYEALKVQVKGAIDNAANVISFCEKTIRSRVTYQNYQEHIDLLIERRDWKYRELGRIKAKSYTWREMYKNLEIKTGDEMFPFLSQYVHGLSVSNIALNDRDDFDAPLSFAICLAGWLLNYLRKVYEPHIGAYTMEDVKKVVPALLELKL